MGNFAQLFQLIEPFVNDAMTFLQAVSVIGAGVMVTYYKLREMIADAQEDQMYSQKAKKIFGILVFVFVVPTCVKILQAYFG